MNVNWKKLITCIAIPLIVGACSAIISGDSMDAYQLLEKPLFAPPGWLFPVVWTILYILMGIASYLIQTSENGQEATTALSVYFLQLMVNFFWPILFFHFGLYFFAFLWLVLLWILILAAILLFSPISKPAAYLLIPYLLWVTFAGYLNLSIYLLNKS